MKPITRYKVYPSNDNICSDPHPHGEWVDFADHEARMDELLSNISHLLVELKAQKRRISTLEEQLNWFSDEK